MAKGYDGVKKTPRPRALEWAIATVVLLVAAGAGVAVAVTRHGSYTAAPSHTTPASPTKPAERPPLTLSFVSPQASAMDVAFRPAIRLTFNSPIAQDSALPIVTPTLPGNWARPDPETLVFQPSAEFFPLERVTVEVPGGPAGLEATNGEHLASNAVWHFTVEDAPVLRLQQLLAELNYLPVAFQPSSVVATPSRGDSAPASAGRQSTANGLAAEPTVADSISLSPLPGTFAWRYSAIPPQIGALWAPGSFDVVTEGAVMAFESDHGLAIDGAAGADVWRALLDAVAARDATTTPYTWVAVTETDPEMLYVWRGGHFIYQTLANTGIPEAPTAVGTWPVYLRFTSTTMSGTNPDGTHYDDPGVPFVSYFNGGDAVHGFWRSQFGFPQSLGCVELPISNAAIVYNYDNYGTLVTVTTDNLAQELGTTPA